MLTFIEINPIAVSIGPIDIRWYGLCYLAGICLGYWCLRARCVRANISLQTLDNLLFAIVLGIIIGGRFGYVFFYDLSKVWTDPLYLLSIWKPGMSFHGGLLGVCTACFITARSEKLPFLKITDFIAPAVPIGLAFGRLGNFINGELWGRVTDVPWAMVFPHAGPFPRHPSPLYGIALEGLLLFIVMQMLQRRAHPIGFLSGCFILGYGLIRSFEELFRAPDAHIGFIAWDWLTMGQLLSLPMVALGLGLVLASQRRKPHAPVS